MMIITPSLLGAALRTQRAGATKPATARTATSARTEGARPASRHAVSAAMAQRIAAIAPDDPERPRKAVRIYLEAELAREFGAGLLNDPEFPALLDAVQQRMQEDAQTASAVESLANLLLAGRLQNRSLGPR
jgi:hypothetical protein